MKHYLKILGAVAALSFIALGGVEAGQKKADFIPTVNFGDHNLDQLDAKAVNCDELKRLAKAKTFLIAAGQVVSSGSLECFDLSSSDYDYFKAEGAYLRTKDGLCVVWSCSGVVSLGDGDRDS